MTDKIAKKPFRWETYERGTPRETGTLVSGYGTPWYKYDMDPLGRAAPACMYPDGTIEHLLPKQLASGEWQRSVEQTYRERLMARETAYEKALSIGVFLPCLPETSVYPDRFRKKLDEDFERCSWVGIRPDLVMKKDDFNRVHWDIDGINDWNAEMSATRAYRETRENVRKAIDRGIGIDEDRRPFCRFTYAMHGIEVPMDRFYVIDRTGTIAFQPVSMTDAGQLAGSSVLLSDGAMSV